MSRIYGFWVLIIFLSFACSSVNRSSREYYYQEQKIRHGVVPVDKTIEKWDEKAAKRGNAIYLKHCSDCHGVEGRGDGPWAAHLDTKPSDLTELAKTVPYFHFYVSLSKAQGNMPGWKTPLSEKELSDLTHYVRGLGRPPIE